MLIIVNFMESMMVFLLLYPGREKL